MAYREFDGALAKAAGVPLYINTTTFPMMYVLDREDFIKNRGFQPCVSSIFMAQGHTNDGSFRDTHNGSLVYASGWHQYELLFLEKKHGSMEAAVAAQKAIDAAPLW